MQATLTIGAQFLIPTMVLVVILVEVTKTLGVQSNQMLRAESLLLGVALSFGFALTVAVPADFAGWFMLAVYGLVVGGVTTLFYKMVKDLVFRAIEKYIQGVEEQATGAGDKGGAAG